MTPESKPPLTFQSVGVIGAGAWGTALAQLCAANGARVALWAREAEVARAIAETRENPAFLPGVRLHASLEATDDPANLSDCEAFLFVAPAQFARSVMTRFAQTGAQTGAPVALCAKGIERTTGRLMSEVLAEAWPRSAAAVLSGPSFAQDVARGLPTAVTLAAADPSIGARWVATIGASHFRPYLSDDLIGAELGGAVKNVLAIGAGAVIGMGFGESARAALVARGFAEFQRLGVAMGARPETMAGLSGLGDLILTAGSENSRNTSLGVALGRGATLDEIQASRNSVAEGVATAPAILLRAKEAGVAMPICAAVADLVSGARALDEIVAALLARPFRRETD